MPPHTSSPDSLFEMAYTARDPCQNRRGTLRFPLQITMRPSSIAPNPVESREAPPYSTVFLTSHRHPEKLPEVTVTSRGNTGFPATTREKTRDFDPWVGKIPWRRKWQPTPVFLPRKPHGWKSGLLALESVKFINLR